MRGHVGAVGSVQISRAKSSGSVGPRIHFEAQILAHGPPNSHGEVGTASTAAALPLPQGGAQASSTVLQSPHADVPLPTLAPRRSTGSVAHVGDGALSHVGGNGMGVRLVPLRVSLAPWPEAGVGAMAQLPESWGLAQF